MHHKRGANFLHTQNGFQYVYYYLLAGIIMVVAAFLFAAPARAQEVTAEIAAEETAQPVEPAAEVAEASSGTAAAEQGTEQGTEETQETEVLSEEVLLDEDVRTEDLVGDATVTAPGTFHFLKRMTRTVKEAVAFDPVKKAELRLRHANLNLLEGQKAAEEGNGNAAAKAFERYETKVEKISDLTEKLKERVQSGDGSADQLLDRMLDNQIKQQKILEKVERQVSEQAPAAVADALLEHTARVKQTGSKTAGEMLANVGESDEALTARVNRVLESQAGSEFKDIRNLEVLKRVQEQVPPQAKDAIGRAMERRLEQFNDRFAAMPQEGRAQKFERYVSHVGGDETVHMEIFEDIKQLQNVPPELLEKIEKAKDIAARRFQTRLEDQETRYDDEAFRERARGRSFARFTEGAPDPEKMKVFEEIRQRVQFEHEDIQKEMESQQDQMIGRFVKELPNLKPEAEEFRRLSQEMGKNPNPATFRLLQQLEARVHSEHPEAIEVFDRIEREAKTEFAKRAVERQGQFFDQITTTNPEDIEIVKRLQAEFAANPGDFFGPPPFGEDGEFPGQPPFEGGEFPGRPPFEGPPPGFERVFEQLLQTQTDRIRTHVEGIDDPELFEQFQQKLKGAPEDVFSQLGPNFRRQFEQKAAVLEQQQSEEVFRKIEQERQDVRRTFQTRFQDESLPPAEREALIQQEREALRALDEKDRTRRREQFDRNLGNDPFCDDACRAEEKKFFEARIGRERAAQGEREEFFDIERQTREFTDKQRTEEERLRMEQNDRRRVNEERLPIEQDIRTRGEEGRVPERFEIRHEGPEGEFRFDERIEIRNDGRQEFRREEQFNGEAGAEFRAEFRSEFRPAPEFVPQPQVRPVPNSVPQPEFRPEPRPDEPQFNSAPAPDAFRNAPQEFGPAPSPGSSGGPSAPAPAPSQ